MKVPLITYLAYKNNCDESELKYIYKFILEYYIEQINSDDVSLEEWNEVIHYIFSKDLYFQDSFLAKQWILYYLQESNEDDFSI